MFNIKKSIIDLLTPEIKNFILKNSSFWFELDGKLEHFVVMGIDEIMHTYNKHYDLFGYDIIPFASLDDDFLCIQRNSSIKIVYWSTERALESREMAISYVNSNINDFLRKVSQVEPI